MLFSGIDGVSSVFSSIVSKTEEVGAKSPLDTMVNPKNINDLKLINNIDGYLIGGASQDPKKFIDIIKKRYS